MGPRTHTLQLWSRKQPLLYYNLLYANHQLPTEGWAAVYSWFPLGKPVGFGKSYTCGIDQFAKEQEIHVLDDGQQKGSVEIYLHNHRSSRSECEDLSCGSSCSGSWLVYLHHGCMHHLQAESGAGLWWCIMIKTLLIFQMNWNFCWTSQPEIMIYAEVTWGCCPTVDSTCWFFLLLRQ